MLPLAFLFSLTLTLPAIKAKSQMPTIEIECSNTVHYSKSVEVTDEQAARYREAFDKQDKQEVQRWLDEWIDTRYDVQDAGEYDILNTSIDDEPLYL